MGIESNKPELNKIESNKEAIFNFSEPAPARENVAPNSRRKTVWRTLASGAAILLLAGIRIAFAEEHEDDERDEALIGLPAPQIVRAINAAVGAKTGTVSAVEVKREENVVRCDVKILANDGKTYKILVNPANGQVLSVSLDGKDDDDERVSFRSASGDFTV